MWNRRCIQGRHEGKGGALLSKMQWKNNVSSTVVHQSEFSLGLSGCGHSAIKKKWKAPTDFGWQRHKSVLRMVRTSRARGLSEQPPARRCIPVCATVKLPHPKGLSGCLVGHRPGRCFTCLCPSLPSNLVPPKAFPDKPGSYPHQWPRWSERNHLQDDLPFSKGLPDALWQYPTSLLYEPRIKNYSCLSEIAVINPNSENQPA